MFCSRAFGVEAEALSRVIGGDLEKCGTFALERLEDLATNKVLI